MTAIEALQMIPIDALLVPLQLGDLIPREGSRVLVFELIFRWFLVLGTIVGIVVITYMFWNAYKFRDTGDEDEYEDERPQMGEIPQGGGKGRKLFTSFGMSALIVVSLIIWTYGAVLYVENPAQQIAQEENEEPPIEVRVVGYQFGWQFEYVNYNYTSNGELVIPEDRTVALTITSRDVFHNFGIPAFRVKADAIPGQTNEAWFEASDTGDYTAKCFELCGAGHSAMVADVTVLSESDWEDWKAENLENASGSVQDEGSTGDDAASVAAPGQDRIAPGYAAARAHELTG